MVSAGACKAVVVFAAANELPLLVVDSLGAAVAGERVCNDADAIKRCDPKLMGSLFVIMRSKFFKSRVRHGIRRCLQDCRGFSRRRRV